MNKIATLILSITFGFLSFQIHAQNQQQQFELETTYMNCLYGIFDDEGEKLQDLIKKAEQKLVKAKLLRGTNGESYLMLFKNIETVVDNKISSFGISEYVINGMTNNKKIKQYMACMQGMMESEAFKNSKINKIIQLSSSGNSDTKISAISDKLRNILEANDFQNDFYKYLTFSLIDKFNTYEKSNGANSKG